MRVDMAVKAAETYIQTTFLHQTSVLLKEKLTEEVNKDIEESVFMALVQADEDEHSCHA